MTTAQSETLHYANTVRSQIGLPTMLAVGARDLRALPECEAQRGGLRFTVNRTRLTRIAVRLMWNDTYTVEFVRVNPRTGAERTVESAEEVYCDQLADVVYRLSCCERR